MVSNRGYPQLRYIASITLGKQTVVTFTDDIDFTDGEYISFRISSESGTRELNNVRAKVITHDSTSVTVDVESNGFTPFVAGLNIQYPPLAVPSASGFINGQYVPTVNLEDSFDMMRVS